MSNLNIQLSLSSLCVLHKLILLIPQPNTDFCGFLKPYFAINIVTVSLFSFYFSPGNSFSSIEQSIINPPLVTLESMLSKLNHVTSCLQAT